MRRDSAFIAENISQNILDFVKIILKKNNNFVLTLRKRLFYNAKPTLLPCKTAAFGMQNNRFCNALIIRWLRNRHSCEKYLHLYRLFSVYKIRENLSVYRIFKFYYFFASKLLLFLLLMKYGVISYIVSRFRSISF